MVLAGHETTSNSLTWLFYLLAQNTKAQDEIREEISKVLNGKAPEFKDVSKIFALKFQTPTMVFLFLFLLIYQKLGMQCTKV